MDVIIVGAGLGGLLCGAELAEAGLRVAVLESAPQVGGRAGSDLVAGQWLDRGAHAVFAGGALDRALQRHGVRGRTQPVPLSGVAVQRDGHHHALGPLGLLAGGWLGLSDRRALLGFAARVAFAPGDGSLHERVVAPLQPGTGRDLVEAMVRISTYCGDLRALGAEASLPHLRRALGQGVRYVHGGWQTLADGLVSRIEAHGGEVCTGCPCRSIEAGEVRTADGVWQADAVVVAAAAPVVRRLTTLSVADNLVQARVGSLTAVIPSERTPDVRAVISLDAPTFLSDFSPVVSLGPDDHHVVHVTHYEPHRAQAEVEARATLEAWCPGWETHAAAQRWLPRLATHPDLPGPGASRRPAQLGDGLWWVNSRTGDGLLADGVADAAFRVSEAVRHRLLRSAA